MLREAPMHKNSNDAQVVVLAYESVSGARNGWRLKLRTDKDGRTEVTGGCCTAVAHNPTVKL